MCPPFVQTKQTHSQVVNALSQWAEVEVVRGGKRHSLSFERGKTQGDLFTADAGAEEAGGTAVRFLPDPEVSERFLG